MPKKLSEIQKKEIIDLFVNGETIVALAEKYQFSKITITRLLKQAIDQKTYKKLVKDNKKNKSEDVLDNLFQNESNTKSLISEVQHFEANSTPDNGFVELTPLIYDVDNEPRKDLSSVQISEVNLPKLVYMIVDNKIELQTKYLKDYPDWQFLSKDELNRKTIEIYFDLKIAKRFCNKEQKVIKVPNTDVFKVVANILLKKGISRIVNSDKLIAL